MHDGACQQRPKGWARVDHIKKRQYGKRVGKI